ncbi:MAG: phospho-N-acetylmuramoyl-pentapeptide-transferase, partial [Alphaproteobacteria bacterium]|nr:phospho-N-acetylmuramoyl-pentapeptide-transferase [Alphaproteobacteria bacterium]
KHLDGMRSRTKFVLQVAIMAACGYGVLGTLPRESAEMLWIPSFNVGIDVGWWALPLAIFVGVGTTNAVNLSDGLDGLAAGLMAMAAAGLTAVALLMSANDSLLTNAPEHAATLAAIIAGASVGFLFYNRHPARVFMGDTGSLALGAGLGMLAVSLRQELLLVLFGAVFVAEALSVMIQVTYFRLTGGKRIFRCSPLHHHFQFMGWHETKVTRRFWAICAMFCALALAAVWFGRVDHDSPTTQQQAQNKHTPSPAVSVRR